jgi:hypothetical protein
MNTLVTENIKKMKKKEWKKPALSSLTIKLTEAGPEEGADDLNFGWDS